MAGPYGSRNHRAPSKKRGPKRRTRKRSKKQRLSRLAVARALSGPRVYVSENRNQNIQAPQNVVYWTAIKARNSPTDLNAILAQAGQDGGGVVVMDKDNDVRFEGGYQQIHFRNVSNQPCFFSVYTIKSKHNESDAAAGYTATNIAMKELFQGWDDKMQAAQAAVAGTVVAFTTGNNFLTSTSATLKPQDSKHFMAAFSIVSSHTMKLESGGDYYHSYKVPPYVHSIRDSYDAISGTINSLVGNKTVMTLVAVRGVLGKGSANDALVGWTKTDLAYEDRFRCKYFRLGAVDRTLAMADVAVSAAIGILEAPGAEVMQAEDA